MNLTICSAGLHQWQLELWADGQKEYEFYLEDFNMAFSPRIVRHVVLASEANMTVEAGSMPTYR